MSHETLAAAWSALGELHDLSAGLRDAVGNFVLRSCRSSYDPIETPQRFLEYALELSITFDTIRFFSKTDSQSPPSLQEDLISSVSHFLMHAANDFGGSKSLIRNPAHIHILGHALCSAVCTLRACAWDCRSQLGLVLARAAEKLLANAPVGDEQLWLMQVLAHLLSKHYGSEKPIEHSSDQSNTRWRMLWETVRPFCCVQSHLPLSLTTR